MSAALLTRLRQAPGIAGVAALLSFGLHLGLLATGICAARSAQSANAATRLSDVPAPLPVDLSEAQGGAHEQFVDVALMPQEVRASEPSPPGAESQLAAASPHLSPQALATPPPLEPTRVRQRKAEPKQAESDPQDGEDWLGLKRVPAASSALDESTAQAAEPNKSHHTALIERLFAAEQRKAAARAALQAPPPGNAEQVYSTASAAPSSAQPAAPGEAAVASAATASPTARKLQAANSLSQAAAWTIPYACATDPIWERASSTGGRIELRVQLVGGRVTETWLQGDAPAHLKKLADGVTFYLQQGYRAREGRASDGTYLLQISVRTAAGPKNQSLGFDADQARSHFTLITGRRVEAEVTERRGTR